MKLPINNPLDKLVILWVMGPASFLVTILQIPGLRFVIREFVIMAVLFAAIVFRLQTRPVSRRTLHLILLTSILTAAFLGIEWLHFWAGRKTIDGLTDLRMIVYSSFYGSVIIFVLYSIYLTSLSEWQKTSHLNFVIKLLSCFHVFFLGYWLLLYLGWIEPIPRTNLLQSNSVSYGALFVLCVMLFYRDAIELNEVAYKAFVVINTAVIFLNQTRGAILGLAVIACYCLVKSAQNARRAMLYCVLLGSLSGIVTLAALTSDEMRGHVLGKDAGALEVVLHEISDAYERGETSVVVTPGILSDESSLSAFSRIGSNYYSLLSFLDNPFLGIGQAESYAIKVLGSGVHSLHFLMANSTGIVGVALFTAVVATIVSAQNFVVLSPRFAMVFFLFFSYVLVFNNSMPVYFSLVVTLLASQRQISRCATQNQARPDSVRADASNPG